MTLRRRLSLFAALGILLSPAAFVPAADWPQILGPARNGVAAGERIRRTWDGDTPREMWSHEVGQGYAGVAVAGPRVVLFHRVANQELVEALDRDTGETLWSARWPAPYRARIDPDSGPRCVPLIHDEAVYLHGVAGRVVCLQLGDGQERWARDTRQDFQFPEAYFGVGSSPLVVDDKLIVNVGAPGDAGVVAFSRDTGATVWQKTAVRASYSSPLLVDLDGRSLVLLTSWLEFLGLDPADGAVEFSIPYGLRGPTVTAANPVVVDERHVFLSASYRIGARLVRIDTDGDAFRASTVWDADDVMSSQYPTAVLGHGVLYGIHGREDGATPSLRCIDPQTRKVYWSKDRFGMATLILAGDTLLAMRTDGELVLVDATREAYRELARFRLFDSTTRALPALSNGQLYVRDDRLLKCFDVGDPAR